MSIDRNALLAAIAYADDDDQTPWMAFADWLEEHGETVAAAFVQDSREFPAVQGITLLNWERYRPIVARLQLPPGIEGPIEGRAGSVRVTLPIRVFMRWALAHRNVDWPVMIHIQIRSLSELEETYVFLRDFSQPTLRIGLILYLTCNSQVMKVLAQMSELVAMEFRDPFEAVQREPMPILPRLQSIILNHDAITADTFASLIAQPMLKSLTFMNVRRPILPMLETIREAKSLRSLWVDSQQSLPSTMLQIWTQSLPLERLTLHGFNPLNDRELTMLRSCPRLRDLSMAFMNLSGVRDPGPIAEFRLLERLDLSGLRHSISPAMLTTLAGLPRLTELSLGYNEHLTDSALIPLMDLSNLRILHLHGSPRLTGKCVPILARLRSLRGLDLTGSDGIRLRERELLRRVLPGCVILPIGR